MQRQIGSPFSLGAATLSVDEPVPYAAASSLHSVGGLALFAASVAAWPVPSAGELVPFAVSAVALSVPYAVWLGLSAGALPLPVARAKRLGLGLRSRLAAMDGKRSERWGPAPGVAARPGLGVAGEGVAVWLADQRMTQ